MSLENKELFQKAPLMTAAEEQNIKDLLRKTGNIINELGNIIVEYFLFPQMTREELTRRKDKGESDFSGYIFASIDPETGEYIPENLENLDLSRLDFTDSYMFNVTFDHSELHNTIMKKCHLEKAHFHKIKGDSIDFSGAYLDEVDMELATMTHSKFDCASLINANLLESSFVHSTFCDARVMGAKFYSDKIEGELPSKMQETDFSGAVISSKTKFYECQLPLLKLNRIAICEEAKEKSTLSKISFFLKPKKSTKTGSGLLDVMQNNPLFLEAVKSVIFIPTEDRPKAVLHYLLQQHCSSMRNRLSPSLKFAKKFLNMLDNKPDEGIKEILIEFSGIRKSLKKGDNLLKIFQFYELYCGESVAHLEKACLHK